jgi:carbon monoxide dehydrogenase subunit G
MRIEASANITADRARVFAAMTDFANAAERISGIARMEMLTDGPVGVGTRFRETRIMMKREATETMEVTDFRPLESYTLEAHSCGCHYTTKISVADAGPGQTQVTMSFSGVPKTFAAKLMMPMGWLFRGMLKKCLLKDLTDVKTSLESKA